MRNKIVNLLLENPELNTGEIMSLLSHQKPKTPRYQYKCSRCKKYGHTIRTCGQVRYFSKPASLPTMNELISILAKDVRFKRLNDKQPAIWALREHRL